MIEEGETVVLSARIIPGNERLISRMIGFIYKRGANIIEEKRRLVHVSGHASQEDIRIMTEAVGRSLWYRSTASIECFSGKGVRQKPPRVLRGQHYPDRERRRV